MEIEIKYWIGIGIGFLSKVLLNKEDKLFRTLNFFSRNYFHSQWRNEDENERLGIALERECSGTRLFAPQMCTDQSVGSTSDPTQTIRSVH